MKLFRQSLFAVITIALLIATGCLELSGQRITLRHDAAKDELHIMIQYDGIHDSGNDEYGNGKHQVAAAVKEGEMLFMEWPFHLKPKEIKALAATAEGVPQEVRDFAGVVGDSITVKTIGHHRDLGGEVGGSQLVTIKNAKAFFKSANAAISAGVLREGAQPPAEFARTAALIMAAAKKDHEWISLEGNAIKWTMPIHPREWATLKARGILDIVDQVIAQTSNGTDEEKAKNQKDFLRVLGALTSASIQFSDSDGMLIVRIGDVKETSTVRIDINKTYKPNLVDAVTAEVPTSTDDAMVKLMLGEKVEKDADLIGEIMKWGPPEEKVRGLIKSIKANDAKLAGKAVGKLEAFAEAWNEKEAVPAAPKPAADTEEYYEAWKKWYEAMKRFPLPGDDGQ